MVKVRRHRSLRHRPILIDLHGCTFTGAGSSICLMQTSRRFWSFDKQVARNTVTMKAGRIYFQQGVPLCVFGFWSHRATTQVKSNPYYSTCSYPTTDALAGRIKYLDDAAHYWWLRSPNTGNAHNPCSVNTSGTVSGNFRAVYACGAAPACCII